ncbi:hypothetical protein PR003_g5695 [Phytophthora rubi]|uniref:Uncharacterized protein n=1 Tax=Phytophthora rubi TaxID=129364 RepID=A0A6A3MYN7_9STRA|nr:hypothetical protein PR002_g8243 [Phytophthora rubi]KAE9349797.1 hypothetical protein PR003_g5695 [Phytophthora rubi]
MDPAAQLRRQQSGPIAATLARGSSTRQRATSVLPPTSARGPPSANADASQYFSIETRLELKARLTKLQLRLRQLLVQAKLAWMRCFAEPQTTATRAAAVQMVQLGEGLTSSLSRAFDLAAGTATAPLSEYQSLVSHVEGEMARFQQLVTGVAHGIYPQPETDDEDDDSAEEEEEEQEGYEGDAAAEEEVLTYLNRPVHVDLPSMQTYCKHVAPPYSSYLPDNAAKKKLTAAKKR